VPVATEKKNQAAGAQAQAALGIPRNSWGAELQRQGHVLGKAAPRRVVLVCSIGLSA